MSASHRTGLPTDDHLMYLLSEWMNRPVHVVELCDERGQPLGNHGDWIMQRVFEKMLAQYGMLHSSPESAEILVLPPNGALLDTYQAPRLITEKIRSLPDAPLVIFPSSARFKTSDPAMMFEGRKSPVLWICRERYSYDHLINEWGSSLHAANVTVALDHDVVASGNRFIPTYFPKGGVEVSGLLVSRLGVEAKDIPDRVESVTTSRRVLVEAYRRIPSRYAQIRIRRRITKTAQAQANDKLRSRLPSHILEQLDGLPSGANFDISDPTICDRSRYVSEISRAHTVVTNRLHVALPAAVLGKRTFLIDSGYHKLRGVYEQSLTQMPNVTFIARGGAQRATGTAE